MLAIFVVEANENSKSDYMYINTFLKKNYSTNLDNLEPVYMNGKDNYNKKATRAQIEKLKAKYEKFTRVDKREVVFLCVDTDDLSRTENAQSNQKKMEEIGKFCLSEKYELIWFHEVIEQLFIGKRVNKQDKTKEAKRFLRKNNCLIRKDKSSVRNYNLCSSGSSNIRIVLDKYFKKKSEV